MVIVDKPVWPDGVNEGKIYEGRYSKTIWEPAYHPPASGRRETNAAQQPLVVRCWWSSGHWTPLHLKVQGGFWSTSLHRVEQYSIALLTKAFLVVRSLEVPRKYIAWQGMLRWHFPGNIATDGEAWELKRPHLSKRVVTKIDGNICKVGLSGETK